MASRDNPEEKTNEGLSRVTCPKCGTPIDVSGLLYRQISERLRAEFDAEREKERRAIEAEREALARKASELDSARQKQEETVALAVEERLRKERLAQEKTIREQVAQEHAEAEKLLREELERKSKEIGELNRTKAELERLRREKDELAEKLAAEAERKLTERLKEEAVRIRKAEEEKQLLRIAEKDQLISQLTEQLREAQRRAEQGSVQLQGEVQELAIEEWLRKQFPDDEIGEVPKGVRGADCTHVVVAPDGRRCGTILYESKRTKNFQRSWLGKFKDDMRELGATVGVLVTQAMPPGTDRLCQMEGVWVCTFEEFKGLAAVLRDSLVRLGMAVAAQENRGEKMAMLYEYLTSDGFRMRVEAVVEGFRDLKEDLEREKRSMISLWQKREKQIEKVLLNISRMYGEVRGIAGSAVRPVKLLEMGEGGKGESGEAVEK